MVSKNNEFYDCINKLKNSYTDYNISEIEYNYENNILFFIVLGIPFNLLLLIYTIISYNLIQLFVFLIIIFCYIFSIYLLKRTKNKKISLIKSDKFSSDLDYFMPIEHEKASSLLKDKPAFSQYVLDSKNIFFSLYNYNLAKGIEPLENIVYTMILKYDLELPNINNCTSQLNKIDELESKRIININFNNINSL